MAYLSLNALTIPVAAQKREKKWMIVGDRTRAIDGTLLENRNAEKQSWRFRTDFLSQEVGEALQGLLLGHGYHFPWDADLFSRDKYLPATTETDSPTPATAGGKFDKMLRLDATDQVIYSTGLTGDYTVMFWEWDGVSAWDLYVFNSAAAKWKNGATHGGAIVSVTVNGSGQVLCGDLSSAWDLDDLVALPYIVPTAWITGDWAAPAAAFSDLPKLNASGAVLNNKTVSVIAKIESIELTEFYDADASAWEPEGQQVEFTLEEV